MTILSNVTSKNLLILLTYVILLDPSIYTHQPRDFQFYYHYRAVARAPYQVNQNVGQHHYPPKPETAHGRSLKSGQSSKAPEEDVAQTMSQPKPEGVKYMSIETEEEGQCSKDLQLRL